MRVLDGSWRQWGSLFEETSLTIGVLDGVHLGHRLLLDRVCAARGTPTVVTFDPHPVEVLAPGTEPRLITTLQERIALFDTLGIEIVAVLDLEEIRNLAPDTFITEVLVGKLNVATVVTGADFQFGKDRSGDVGLLSALGEQGGFAIEVVDLVASEGTISSSRIRALIEATRVDEASQLLGSWFTLTNEVIRGDGRGGDMGFPTANLAPPVRKVLPGDGVYAAYARLGDEVHPAAVNIGVRPTFGGGPRLVEAFLLDFDRDLYGRELTLEFVDHLRDEMPFDSIDALVEAMGEDVAMSRRILEAAAPNVG